jgi:L-iditol 2-dehydrogenase
MLAYVYDENKKMALKDIPFPEKKSKNCIIKVNAASICGTDIRTYRFGSNKINPPRVIGHEVVGEVIYAGETIKNVLVGERIQVVPAIGCGKCRLCLKGHTNLCNELKTIGFQYDGAFAEYMEVPSDLIKQGNFNKLNNQISDEEAVLAEPIACVVNSHEFLNIDSDSTVAIFGSGFIGSMHIELAKLKGAKKIIMIEVNQSRIEKCKQYNPDIEVINPIKENLYELINKITDGYGADVTIVACSVGSAQSDAMKITGKLGRISLFGGLPAESTGFIDSNVIHYKEVSVYGVHASTAKQNRLALEYIIEGKLNVKKYIHNIFKLSDIKNAFESLKNEEIIKAIVKP